MRKQKRWAICALAAAVLLTAGCSGQAADGAAGTTGESAGQEAVAPQEENAARAEETTVFVDDIGREIELTLPVTRACVANRYNNELIRRLNDKAYWDDFMDKVKFNRRFDRQLRRDWLEFAGSTPEDLGRFCEGKEWIMSKPLDACCGKGIEKLRPADFESMEALHEYLQQAGCGLVEEVVVQHPEIAAIYPNAVNTIRMATILTGDKATVVYAFIRIGNKGHVVDNLNSGGMAAPLDVKTGKIKYPAADKDGIVYDRHPQTDTPITGAVIPFWKEAVALCEECAKVIPQVRYVGWDIAITEKGPVVIEGNQFPGHDILQLPVHCPDKIGMLPVIKKALGEA